MLMRRANSTQYNLQESSSVKCGVVIAAIWIAFYAVIAVAGMVVQNVAVMIPDLRVVWVTRVFLL